MQDCLVRAEPDHGKAGACRVCSQGPDIRAAVLAELGGDAEVAGAVAGRCGQRPARRDQRRVQLGHAVAGTPVQLGPHWVPAEIPDDPPLIMMRAVSPGAVRTRLRSCHRDVCIRRQVPGDCRAEHPVADDQEIHNGIIPWPGSRGWCSRVRVWRGRRRGRRCQLAVDTPPDFPASSTAAGPTLAPEELAGRKLLALFDRAAARDFADVRLLARRFGKDVLLARAAPAVRNTSITYCLVSCTATTELSTSCEIAAAILSSSVVRAPYLESGGS